jgi:RNA polymerase sigma factor (sigma-70 family)
MIRNKLKKIYSLESDKMLSYIKKRFGRQFDGYDALDLLQDTFDSLIEKTDVLKPIDNLTAYVYKTLRNKIIDLFRKRKLDYDHEVNVEEIVLEQSALDQLLQQELLELVMLAINELPETQRNIFIQTEIEDKTFKQISTETGISINTLLSQKRYAIKNLKRKLLVDEQDDR